MQTMLGGALRAMGFDVRAMSQELERLGYGNADAILRALESNDEKGLCFVPKLAKELAEKNPEMARRAAAAFGANRQFPPGRNRFPGM